MAVPKKRISISKKRIRKNVWKKKGYWTALKAFSLAKSLSTGKSERFFGSTGKSKGFLGSTGKSKGFLGRSITNQ